jgi:hypothetical protein
MYSQRFSVPHLSPVVLLGLWVLCVPLAWTQRTQLTKQTAFQLSDHGVSLAAFPEDKTQPFSSYGKMPLGFTPNVSQAQSGSSRASGIHLLFPPNKPTLGLDNKANYLIGNAPQKWQTDVLPHTHYQRAYPRDLQYYGQRAPLVGSSILRILKQADSHPQVTRVLQLLKPRF